MTITSIFASLATLNAVLKIVSFLINLRWFRKRINLLISSFQVNHLNCFYVDLRVLWFTFKDKSVRQLLLSLDFVGKLYHCSNVNWYCYVLFLKIFTCYKWMRSVLKKAHCKSNHDKIRKRGKLKSLPSVQSRWVCCVVEQALFVTTKCEWVTTVLFFLPG